MLTEKVIHNFLRIVPFAVLSIILLYFGGDGYHVVLYSIGISLGLAVVSHLIRKAFFPYIDLKVHAQKALETPLSAGLVVLGICYLLATVFQASISLLK